MGRALIIIGQDTDRTKACAWVQKAPNGTRIEFRSSKRSLPQNSRMWLMLTRVSEQLVWHGQKYTTDEWKDYFCHALRGEKWMPFEEGGMIPIGRSTSSLSKDEHSELTMLIEAFAARQGVTLFDDEQAA